ADSVVAAGAAGVARLRCDDGSTVWRYAPPSGAETVSFRTLADPEPPDPLAGFVLAGSRLLRRHGPPRLLAVDAESGAPAWSWRAPGAHRFLDPGDGVNAQFFADLDHVLVQWGASGCYAQLDAATGRVRSRSTGTAPPWVMPPVALDESSVVLVPDPEHVARVDLADGREAWRYAVEGPSSLSGDAVQVRRAGSSL